MNPCKSQDVRSVNICKKFNYSSLSNCLKIYYTTASNKKDKVMYSCTVPKYCDNLRMQSFTGLYSKSTDMTGLTKSNPVDEDTKNTVITSGECCIRSEALVIIRIC